MTISKADFVTFATNAFTASELREFARTAIVEAGYSKTHHNRLMDEVNAVWFAADEDRLAAIIWNACTWAGNDPEAWTAEAWSFESLANHTAVQEAEGEYLTVYEDEDEDFAPIVFERIAGDCIALADTMADEDAVALADEMADEEAAEYIWVVEDWS